jgi:hypothetical protein
MAAPQDVQTMSKLLGTSSTPSHANSPGIYAETTPTIKATVNDFFQRIVKPRGGPNSVRKGIMANKLEADLTPTGSVPSTTSSSDERSILVKDSDEFKKTTPLEPAKGLNSPRKVIQEKMVYPVSCGCAEHWKHLTIDKTYSLNVNQIWKALYEGDCGAYVHAHSICESENFKLKPWNPPSGRTGALRELQFRVSFYIPFKGKSFSDCFEVQRVLIKDRGRFVIETETKTPGAPYGDCFNTCAQVCVTQLEPKKVRLRVGFKVKFSKRVMWEGKIESGGVDGSAKFWTEVDTYLKKLEPPVHGFESDDNELDSEMAESKNEDVAAEKIGATNLSSPATSAPTAAIIETLPIASSLNQGSRGWIVAIWASIIMWGTAGLKFGVLVPAKGVVSVFTLLGNHRHMKTRLLYLALLMSLGNMMLLCYIVLSPPPQQTYSSIIRDSLNMSPHMAEMWTESLLSRIHQMQREMVVMNDMFIQRAPERDSQHSRKSNNPPKALQPRLSDDYEGRKEEL